MALRSFTVSSTDSILDSSVTDSVIYVRSTSASDTSQTVTVQGVNISTISTSEAVSLDGKVEQATTEAGWDSLLSVTLSAACAGVVNLYEADSGTAATGDIRINSQPSNGETLLMGLSGSTRTYTFKTTVATDGDIKIGSTTAETADNIASAINNTSTGTSTPVDDTDWSATAADPIFSATVATNVISLTDRIPCRRLLAYHTLSGTASGDFDWRVPIGGVDGTRLGYVDIAATSAFDELDLAGDQTVTTDNLPGSLTPTSDVLAVNSRPVTIYYNSADIGSAIAWKIQVSADGTNFVDATTINASNAMTSLDNNGLKASTLLDVDGVAMNSEYIRAVITTNANTAPVSIFLAANW